MGDRRFRVPGRYRRSFSWRISDGTIESQKPELTGMNCLATSELPDILEDYLAIRGNRRHNWSALSRLQLHLIEELLIQEGAVKHFKESLRELGADPDAELRRDESSQDIAFARAQLFFHRLYASACRAIGDGIAWRALGYDRAVTRTLCERQTQQTLASQGTIQELREWGSHFDRGTGLAIFNALTNCLSIGDVTVVHDDDSVEVIEVKSSNTKSRRKVRQKEKLREVVTRLTMGEGQVDGHEVQIEILRVTPETGLDRVQELLDQTSVKGWAAEKISNSLYVETFDLRKRPDDASTQALQRIRSEVIGVWENRGDMWSDMNTHEVLAFSPNAAPFSIFPFTAKTCVELLIGAKNYIVYLNESAVVREFEHCGWTVEWLIPRNPASESEVIGALEQARQSIIRVSKGAFHAEIPPAVFMRMQIETLRPKSIIDAYEAIYDRGPSESGFSMFLFEGEAETWD